LQERCFSTNRSVIKKEKERKTSWRPEDRGNDKKSSVDKEQAE